MLLILTGRDRALAARCSPACGGSRRRGGRLTERALAISRDHASSKRHRDRRRRCLRSVAAVAVGGTRLAPVHQLRPRSSRASPPQHFGQLSGAGRQDSGEVAIDAFGEKPILGHGAGTYQFAWDQLRSIDMPVLNAHSLYLQAFAELGVVGGLLVLGLVGALLWCRLRRLAGRARAGARALRGPARGDARLRRRRRLRLVLADRRARRGLLPGGRGLVAARCAQLCQARADAERRRRERRRFGLAVAGLAVAWITALALIGPLLVDREIECQSGAAAGGEPRQRRRPRQHGALDRALGGVSLRAARPARRAPEANTRPRSGGSRRRSNARTTTGSSTTCARRPSTRRAESDSRPVRTSPGSALNPSRPACAEGWDGCG